jgi:putative membrane protein insertion efficiency factor
MNMVLCMIIRFYQLFVSPFLPRVCRFYPSCSNYAKEAIKTYGTARGVLLAVRRLSRCHPLGPSGFDPVPRNSSNPPQ